MISNLRILICVLLASFLTACDKDSVKWTHRGPTWHLYSIAQTNDTNVYFLADTTTSGAAGVPIITHGQPCDPLADTTGQNTELTRIAVLPNFAVWKARNKCGHGSDWIYFSTPRSTQDRIEDDRYNLLGNTIKEISVYRIHDPNGGGASYIYFDSQGNCCPPRQY